jgi:hypothetical protein
MYIPEFLLKMFVLQSSNNYYDIHFIELYNLFSYFTICIFNSAVVHNDMSSHYCIFFVEYFPEDDRVRPKLVRGLPHACILLCNYSAIVCMCIAHLSCLSLSGLLRITVQSTCKEKVEFARDGAVMCNM